MTAPLRIQRFPHPQRPASSCAVRVEDGPTVWTAQLVPNNVSEDARAQTEQMIDQLGALLTRMGSDLRRVVRLNLYLADDQKLDAVEKVIATRFMGVAPAISVAHSPVMRAGAVVACDAVAAADPGAAMASTPDAAIMPAGVKVFVSGQARRASDLAASVAQTMEDLHRSITHLGMTKSDVVQVKAFIQPFASHAIARAEIEKSYGGKAPPIILMEWLSDSPTEIELVGSGQSLTASSTETASYLGLPGMTNSPYYCRVATVAAGVPLIFIGSLDSGEGGSARDHWRRVFEQLAGTLLETGSSFRHMIKATYYLVDSKARAALGEIRSVYYDPSRPPAASAIDLKSLGRPGPAVALDMIAIPVVVKK